MDPSQITSRLLILTPSHLGDLLIVSTLLQLIKQYDSHIIIDALAPKSLAPLLIFMPEINHIIPINCTHKDLKLWTRYQTALALKKNHYDTAIILQNSFKSALPAFWANIPKRIGYNKECRHLLLTDYYPFDKKKERSYLQQQISLLEKIGLDLSKITLLPVPHLQVSTAQQEMMRKKFNLSLKQPILILCPGAQYGPSKQWPADHFVEIAKRQLAKDWDVWILGANWDEAIAANIEKKLSGKVKNFTGLTSIEEVVILMSFARTVLTNDSGLMHVAAALDKKIIAIYGSSSTNYTPPLTDKATLVSLQLACSPCFKKKCPYGHYNCLKKITPEMIPDFE